MSDSDELLSNNLLAEQTMISVRGPNINTTNLAGLRFRNNVTMNNPRNYQWQRRPESSDQRSMSYRRETSPMSIASACDVRQRNYHNSFYTGFSSQRSVCNGRSGSPTMSMRSINSNVTTADIISALENTEQLSKYEQQKLLEACSKYMKRKARRRVEKRRNVRRFLKGYIRKSGNDSGELGSNSSISSDDNRSTRTLNYRNISSCPPTKAVITGFRNNIKESNMFTDYTDKYRQNSMCGVANTTANMTQSSVSSFRRIAKPIVPTCMAPAAPAFNFTKQNQSSINQSSMLVTQKDRFQNGFLLPSQRFNRSVATTSIPEISVKPPGPDFNKHPISYNKAQNNNPCEINSEDDNEIFSELTSKEKSQNNQRKRSLICDDLSLPAKKKPKIASPIKNTIKSSNVKKFQNDFEFAKPTFPVRKSSNLKTKEKLISTSTKMNPTEEFISKSATLPQEDHTKVAEIEEEIENDNTIETNLTKNTDVSMRPSFIKRKLFSQKMNITETKNDTAVNSPQNSFYGQIQKEKNKARKYATSQYCLSRDVQTDENNLLDLIHKIVPAEHMNYTNRTVIQNNKTDEKDNWDVTSIISTRIHEDELSDTFTDEDNVTVCNGKIPSPKTVRKVQKSPTKKVQRSPQKNNSSKMITQQKVKPVQIEKKANGKDKDVKVSDNNILATTENILAEKNGTSPKTVQNLVKNFWDTDFESDAELTPALRKVTELKKDNKEDVLNIEAPKTKFQGFSCIFPVNKMTVNNSTILNNTVNSIQKFNNTNMFKKFSHLGSKPQKLTSEKMNESVVDPTSRKPNTTKPKVPVDDNKVISSESVNQNKPILQKSELKKPSPKKQKKKANTEKTAIPAEETKKQSIIKDVVASVDEAIKTPYKKSKKMPTETTASKDKLSNNENKILHPPKNNKNEPSTNKITQNPKTVNSQKNKNSKTKKVIKTPSKNNKTDKLTVPKLVLTKLSDSLIYENSLNETSNTRPVRSCRISKQNSTLDSSRDNRTLNVTLRSQVTKPQINNAKNKYKKTTDELGSLAHKKPLSSINTQLRKAREIDTSDISFSLKTDKGSPVTKGNIYLRNKSMHTKELTQEQRPLRKRVVNKRYQS